MRLRAWHVAAALAASLGLHGGAVGLYLAREEPTLVAGGGPIVSAELGELFVDAIQAGTDADTPVTGETAVPDVVQPADVPEAERTVEQSTALVASVEPEAADPAKVPVVETAKEVALAQPVQAAPPTEPAPSPAIAATAAPTPEKPAEQPAETPAETVAEAAATTVPELAPAAAGATAWASAGAAATVTARQAEPPAVEAAASPLVETATPPETVEAATESPVPVPVPAARPADLRVAEVRREAPARQANEVRRQREAPSRQRTAGGQRGAGGQSAATATSGGAARLSPVPDAGNADFTNYKGQIQRRLERSRRRVREIGNRRGAVTVRFTIQASGAVSSVRVVGSSGDPVIDRGAVDLVQRAAPFPPMPASLGQSKVWTLPLSFQ